MSPEKNSPWPQLRTFHTHFSVQPDALPPWKQLPVPSQPRNLLTVLIFTPSPAVFAVLGRDESPCKAWRWEHFLLLGAMISSQAGRWPWSGEYQQSSGTLGAESAGLAHFGPFCFTPSPLLLFCSQRSFTGRSLLQTWAFLPVDESEEQIRRLG